MSAFSPNIKLFRLNLVQFCPNVGPDPGVLSLTVNLHPTEMKWIKENAKSFAQQLNGGVLPTAQQIIEAEQRLAQQAYRQVQYGVGGEADVSAMAFLKQANGLLAADPNCSTCGPGYMFYATPEQKLNVAMYGTNLQQTNDFYAKNGLSKPTLQQIIDGARSAGQKTDLATQRTNPVPGGPQPLNQDNDNIVRYRGGNILK